MPLATNTTLGDIHLSGDLAGGSDAYNPALTPTGVVPGSYAFADIVVDQKGRTLWVETGDIVPLFQNTFATSTELGIARFGTNINNLTDGRFSVITGSNIYRGLVKSADTNHITIVGGSIDIGTGVVTSADANKLVVTNNTIDIGPFVVLSANDAHLSVTNNSINIGPAIVKTTDSTHITATSNTLNVGTDVVVVDRVNTFTKRQLTTLFSLPTTGNITPDLAITDLFSINMSADGVLKVPSNLAVGDKFNIIVSTGGFTLTFDPEYKIRSYPLIPIGTAVVTCLVVEPTKIYTIIQHNFI